MNFTNTGERITFELSAEHTAVLRKLVSVDPVSVHEGIHAFEFTEDQFLELLVVLGMEAGKGSREELHGWLRFADAVNAGNPGWRPYFPEDGGADHKEI